MIYIFPTDTCFWIACPITDIKWYEKIYKIKKRSYEKPLAIIVEDFKWLENYTDLTKEQVEFLKEYKKPFTILTESNYTKIWINFVDEETWDEFRNRTVYEKIAFRVANNDIEKKLIKKFWPMFLTSANISDNDEIYNLEDIKEIFWDYLDRWVIKLEWEKNWDLKETAPSEIFEFEWESLNQKFLRK